MANLVRHHTNRGLENAAHIRRLDRAVVVARERLQSADDPSDPRGPASRACSIASAMCADPLDDGRRASLGRNVAGELRDLLGRVRKGSSERNASGLLDFMRDAGRKRPERGQPDREEQLRLKVAMLTGEHQAIDRHDECVEVDRFLHVRIGVDRRGFGRSIRGECDDGDLREHGIPILLDAKLPAVHHGHHEIEDDHVGARTLPERLERVETVRASGDRVPLHAQQIIERLANARVVLDEEQRRRRTPFGSFLLTAHVDESPARSDECPRIYIAIRSWLVRATTRGIIAPRDPRRLRGAALDWATKGRP